MNMAISSTFSQLLSFSVTSLLLHHHLRCFIQLLKTMDDAIFCILNSLSALLQILTFSHQLTHYPSFLYVIFFLSSSFRQGFLLTGELSNNVMHCSWQTTRHLDWCFHIIRLVLKSVKIIALSCSTLSTEHMSFKN